MDHRHLQFPVKHNGRVPVDERDKSATDRRYGHSAFSREDDRTNIGTKKVWNFSDLIQRFAASCLLRPLTSSWRDSDELPNELSEAFDSEFDEYYEGQMLMEGEDEEDDGSCQEKLTELRVLMNQMFGAASAVKRAMLTLQEAHRTWDPDRMRAADVAVVEELTRLGALGEMWRRRRSSVMTCKKGGGGGGKTRGAGGGSDSGPHELAVEELKARPVDVENLKEKLSVSSFGSHGIGKKKSRSSQSKRKVGCYQGLGTYVYE